MEKESLDANSEGGAVKPAASMSPLRAAVASDDGGSCGGGAEEAEMSEEGSVDGAGEEDRSLRLRFIVLMIDVVVRFAVGFEIEEWGE